jgi:hypothetical protein
MTFYTLSSDLKERSISRIMQQSLEMFNHAVTARHYIELYEMMLQRPLIAPARQISLTDYRNKIPENLRAAFAHVTKRPHDFMRSNLLEMGLGVDRIKNLHRKEVFKCWLTKIKEQMNASRRMRL